MDAGTAFWNDRGEGAAASAPVSALQQLGESPDRRKAEPL